MPNPKDLSNKQLKDHILKQKLWQETYRKLDPASMCIVTAQEIINDLVKELTKRGITYAP